MADDNIIPLRHSYVLSMVERISELEAENERLRAEVSILMYGMEAAWGLLANGQYWDTTDKVRHSEWEHYRNKWRDDYWHPALDRDREARRA